MSEEEKMKLRYLREQKERAKAALLGNANVKTARKKSKFNLGSDDEDQDVMVGFTHKGRRLGDIEDDFKEQIDLSSEDDGHDRDKGKLTEEMVNRMNFGGGELEVSSQKSNSLSNLHARRPARKCSTRSLRSPKRGMRPGVR